MPNVDSLFAIGVRHPGIKHEISFSVTYNRHQVYFVIMYKYRLRACGLSMTYGLVANVKGSKNSIGQRPGLNVFI